LSGRILMIERTLKTKLKSLAHQFPAIAVLGPRQSGKTTLCQLTFPEYKYFSLEDLSIRSLIKEDPKAFLDRYNNEPGIILDEVQHIPELFSYMQVYIDKYKKKGYFVVTGSQNFALNEAISQSLAGRIALLTLLPLSIAELKKADLLASNIDQALFKGNYPRIYADGAQPLDWYRSYIGTYIERDVRQIKNVGDLALFQKFVVLCAGRIGQVLNLTSLSNDVGLSLPTIKQWLSVLEASYIIFFLQPYAGNVGKRLIKSPKLYFYDTGLACNLLSITAADQLFNHYLRGNLFESYIIADLIKQKYNHGLHPAIYYWRDQSDYEIDCIMQKGQELIPIEIKVMQTFNPHLLDHLEKWNEITHTKPAHNILVYTGELSQDTKRGKLINWQKIDTIE
jgi:uncharacterized protein